MKNCKSKSEFTKRMKNKCEHNEKNYGSNSNGDKLPSNKDFKIILTALTTNEDCKVLVQQYFWKKNRGGK